jgi:hypothetical protein
MSQFTDFFPSATGGGGGGGLPGGGTTVNSGVSYATTTSGSGVFGGLETSIGLETVSSFGAPTPALPLQIIQKGANHPSTSVDNRAWEYPNSSTTPTLLSNGSYTTRRSVTGGGIFWGAGHSLGVSGSPFSSNSFTITQQSSMRITIDGGTPFIFASPSRTLTRNSGDPSQTFFIKSAEAHAQLLFETTEDLFKTSSGDEDNRTKNVWRSLGFPIYNGTYNSNGTVSVLNRIISSFTAGDTSYALTNLNLYPDVWYTGRGFPGIQFTTSLLVETLSSSQGFAPASHGVFPGYDNYTDTVTQF